MKNLKFALIAAMATTGLVASAAVMKPSIRPAWSGATAGVWTMDYETALEKAEASGKYTLMYFSGMWWCPRCQELEEYVLTQPVWKRFVKQYGLYLTVIDNPARNGKDRWCWLWDNSFRKSAKLSAEDAAAVIAERYNLQEELHDPSATRLRNATNYVVEVVGKGKNVTTNYTVYAENPVSEYHSVNYPGIVIFAPDGSVAGTFIPDTSENPEYTLDNALEYCISNVTAAINPAAINDWVGNWTLAYTEQGFSGAGSLALSINKKGSVKITGYAPDGSKVSVTAPFVTGAKTCYIPVRYSKKDEDPAFTIRIDNATGELSIESDDDSVKLYGWSSAGVKAPESLVCTISDFPEEIDGCAVVGDSVPTNFVMTVKGATLKGDNGIKFTYTQKTGAFKGSFKVQVLKNGRVAKVNVAVNGVCVGENAVGSAFPNGADDTAMVLLEPADEKPEDECDFCGL